MGIIPLQYATNENADTLAISGREQFSIDIPQDLMPGQTLNVTVS
jgi:aconitate hydratase